MMEREKRTHGVSRNQQLLFTNEWAEPRVNVPKLNFIHWFWSNWDIFAEQYFLLVEDYFQGWMNMFLVP